VHPEDCKKRSQLRRRRLKQSKARPGDLGNPYIFPSGFCSFRLQKHALPASRAFRGPAVLTVQAGSVSIATEIDTNEGAS
jgi:hypothetical protein